MGGCYNVAIFYLLGSIRAGAEVQFTPANRVLSEGSPFRILLACFVDTGKGEGPSG